MTEAMPRTASSDLPPKLDSEARVMYSQGDLLNVARFAYRRGVFALAHRQGAYAAPVLIVCLSGLIATQMILSLKPLKGQR
jgi:hypothetical protein